MALERVAGPFPLLTLGGTPVTDLTVNPNKAGYDDAIGLFAYSATLGGECVIQLDGTTCLRSAQNRDNAIALDLQTPNGFLMRSSVLEDKMWKLLKPALFIGENVVDSEIIGRVLSIDVRCKDRYLSFLSNQVRSRPLDFSGDWLLECLINFAAFSFFQQVSRTRDPYVLAVADTNGEILFYNHITKTQLPQRSFVPANAGCWYSPRFDLYLVLQNDNTLSIYANSVVPHTLSAVAAVTPLTRGHLSTLRTRLLGDRNEPCPNETVEWSVTGALLENPRSLTDADGYAWNKCIVPTDAVVGASIVVTAKVHF